MTMTMTMITDHEDLLTEILLWLPTKSLIRFKLVCKRWFSIISTNHFSHIHTLHHHHRCRSKPEPSLLLRLAKTSSNYFYLTFHNQKLLPYHFSPPLTKPTISSFSNGLFLLHSDDKKPIEDCYIYNPTTKQYRRILLNVNERYSCVMGLNLAFDPLKSPHYKIVCVRAARRRTSSFLHRCWRRSQIEVYESDTTTWKLFGEPFFAPRDMDFNHGIYWKGGIHWHGFFFDIHDGSVREHPEVLVSGDTGRDNFCHSYVESNGSLHYITHFLKEKSVMVFEMPRDYSQWLLKYDVNLDRASWPVSVLSLVRGESEEDSMLVLHEPGRVIAYNLQDKSAKELIDFREEPFYQDRSIQFVSRYTFQLMETLASV